MLAIINAELVMKDHLIPEAVSLWITKCMYLPYFWQVSANTKC